jgi:hypothetical protein
MLGAVLHLELSATASNDLPNRSEIALRFEEPRSEHMQLFGVYDVRDSERRASPAIHNFFTFSSRRIYLSP